MVLETDMLLGLSNKIMDDNYFIADTSGIKKVIKTLKK